jgi:hypothetical protein
MRAEKFTREGEIQVAIGVTCITGWGFGVVVLDWGSRIEEWMFQLWGGRNGGKKVCRFENECWQRRELTVRTFWAWC